VRRARGGGGEQAELRVHLHVCMCVCVCVLCVRGPNWGHHKGREWQWRLLSARHAWLAARAAPRAALASMQEPYHGHPPTPKPPVRGLPTGQRTLPYTHTCTHTHTHAHCAACTTKHTHTHTHARARAHTAPVGGCWAGPLPRRPPPSSAPAPPPRAAGRPGGPQACACVLPGTWGNIKTHGCDCGCGHWLRGPLGLRLCAARYLGECGCLWL